VRLTRKFEGFPGELNVDLDRPRTCWGALINSVRDEIVPIRHSQTRWTTSPDANPLRADEDCYLCPRTNLSPISPTAHDLVVIRVNQESGG
jgi:hypothetical protein